MSKRILYRLTASTEIKEKLSFNVCNIDLQKTE